MIRWRGEPDPRHVEAVDAYWVSAAEHGMNASTFTARVIASTGADVAACLSGAVGAMSGPLHGGAPSRVLHMIEGVEETGDAGAYVRGVLDRGERLMGFGHRVYRAEDPRARVLRATAERLGAPRYEVAAALEKAALDELHSRRPDRVLATNVEFWAAVVLDFAEVPASMFTPMFTCARTARVQLVQRGPGVHGELVPLGRAGVGVEGQALGGQPLQQHGARIGEALRVDGRQHHGVGFADPVVGSGLGVPALDPGQRCAGPTGRDVGPDQLTVVVQPCAGIAHPSSTHLSSVCGFPRLARGARPPPSSRPAVGLPAGRCRMSGGRGAQRYIVRTELDDEWEERHDRRRHDVPSRP